MKRDAPYMGQSLLYKASIHQAMTPQLQEAIRLLQLSYDDLLPFIEEQITMNPFLQEAEPAGDDQRDDLGLLDIYGGAAKKGSDVGSLEVCLADNALTPYRALLQQIERLFHAPKDHSVALYLLDALDDSGYLPLEMSDVAKKFHLSRTQVERILTKLQQCEPTGVFARNLQECMQLQLEEKGVFDQTYAFLLSRLSALMNGDVTQRDLIKKMGVTQDRLSSMFQTIRALNPKPLALEVNSPEQHVTPEVIVFYNNKAQEWQVVLNPTLRSYVHFDESYYKSMKQQVQGSSEKRYLSQQFSHASWLRKALVQRNNTLLNVASEIVKQQQDFFNKGVNYLKPIILQDIATPLGIHESTVSRITSKKYLLTPHGTVELKYFFTTGFESPQGESISSASLKNHVARLIKQEDPQKPLSDALITKLLNKQGVPIARRTVAKYREALQIAPSFQRKRSANFNLASR